jgi:alpha-glucosidase
MDASDHSSVAELRQSRRNWRLSFPQPHQIRLQVAATADRHPERSWVLPQLTPAGPTPVVDERQGRLSGAIASAEAALNGPEGRFTLCRHPEVPPLTACDFKIQARRSGFQIPLKTCDTVYGLGQGTGPLNRRGRRMEMWNIDVLGHASCIHPNLHRLYQSIPFAIITREAYAVGLFVDDPGRQVWDLADDRVRISVDSPSLDLHWFVGPTVPEVLRQWSLASGRMPLPPRWALGCHQSRYGYRSRQELEQVAREFRQRDIPCDVLHLDIHHMNEYRVFTFGKSFPEPESMLAGLADDGFKVAAIVDPGVKDDPKFDLRQRGQRHDVFVKGRSGGNARGKVWPGAALFPDFLSPATRDWWSEEQARFQKRGLAGFWNDMSEPAIFDRAVHNLYGMMMAAASREGAMRHAPDERPFILSRGGWAGIQRHAAVWTGDNSSCWEHLAEAVPMLLNLGLSGVPFCGADVGGFLDDCTGELLARWTQMAVFTPLFRNHANHESRPQEPWQFGPEIESICRAYMSLRYQLLPYLACQFARAHRDGTPIMRPLLWQWPTDPVAARCPDQFLLGPDLMIAPITRPDAAARSVYLPSGTWHCFLTDEIHQGKRHIAQEVTLAGIPIYVRGGGLVPMAPSRPYIDPASPDEELLLRVYAGGRGYLDWVEDDGWSNAYQQGQQHRRGIEFVDLGDRGSLRFGDSSGPRPSDVKLWHVALHGLEDGFCFAANGHAFEPLFDEENGAVRFALKNDAEAFEITWTR